MTKVLEVGGIHVHVRRLCLVWVEIDLFEDCQACVQYTFFLSFEICKSFLIKQTFVLYIIFVIIIIHFRQKINDLVFFISAFGIFVLVLVKSLALFAVFGAGAV